MSSGARLGVWANGLRGTQTTCAGRKRFAQPPHWSPQGHGQAKRNPQLRTVQVSDRFLRATHALAPHALFCLKPATPHGALPPHHHSRTKATAPSRGTCIADAPSAVAAGRLATTLQPVNPRVLMALVLVCAAAFAAILIAATSVDKRAPAADGQRRFEGATLPRDLETPDFDLTDQDGEPVAMRDLRGQPVIVTFLYTSCEDTCPSQAQQVRATLDELGSDVPALAVAVDPPRDTRASARSFLADQNLTGRMRFVLGRRDELERVWSDFGVQPQREDLEHTARLVLIDPKGAQRVSYPLDQITPERLAHDLRLLQAGA